MAHLYNTRETFSNTALYTTTPPEITSKDSSPPRCSICREFCTLPFVGSTHHALQMPSCSHIFGASCIDTWFDTASTCPMCRKDFFPMKPEEISDEIKELPKLFRQLFNLLDEVKKRYLQQRKMVVAMEGMIVHLGEKVLEDIEERKERTRIREAAQQRLHAQHRLGEVENNLPTEETLPLDFVPITSPTETTVTDNGVIMGPNFIVFPSTALAAIRQETAAFLAHDFAPDLAAVNGSRGIVPDAVIHTRLQNAERLAERAEAFGLAVAAQNIRRRRATILNVIISSQERVSRQLGEGIRRRRMQRSIRAAVSQVTGSRDAVNTGSQRAVASAESEEDLLQRRRQSERRWWDWRRRN